MTTPHDGPGRPGGRRFRPAQRPAHAEQPYHAPETDPLPRQAPPEVSPARPQQRRPRHARADPEPHGRRPGDLRGGPPPERRPRPPARRRRSPNEGVPPDENPTEILDLGFADEYADDEVDEYERDGDHDHLDERDERDDADEDRAEPQYFDGDDDEEPPRATRRRGKRLFGWLAALVILALLAGGAYYGARELLGFGYEDYTGPGERDVLLHVEQGDSTGAIAAKLRELDVVASAEAFVSASEDDQRVLSIQPGYYVVQTKLPGADAVATLVEPDSRVGQLQLRAGTQLDDITQPDGTVTPGVFTLLSAASCADLNGESTCVPAEELRRVAETADLAELGVPEWAIEGAERAEPARRIEGLVAPGVYDVRPGWDAKRLLTEVLTMSAARMQAAGLPDAAGSTGYTPYEILIIASLVEREAVKQDFEKVARVIYNRLEIGQRLQFDSTVNYVLDRPEVRTNDHDRLRAGPYNTYQNTGLPPTPIAAPSTEAITAAEQPAEGEWLYFVKCETNGLSCFADDYAEHQRNVTDARGRGVF